MTVVWLSSRKIERERGAADRQAKTETNGAGGSVLTITANKREKLLERT